MIEESRKREEICYVQNCEQMRRLNSQMNHVPALAVTLTGGLWYGAGAFEEQDPAISIALLIFAGLCNIALILIACRIRDVLESYLERIEEFHPKSFASGIPKNPYLPRLGSYSMITIFCFLMALAAMFSVIGVLWMWLPMDIRICGCGAAIILMLPSMYFLFNWLRRAKKKSNAIGDENA